MQGAFSPPSLHVAGRFIDQSDDADGRKSHQERLGPSRIEARLSHPTSSIYLRTHLPVLSGPPQSGQLTGAVTRYYNHRIVGTDDGDMYTTTSVESIGATTIRTKWDYVDGAVEYEVLYRPYSSTTWSSQSIFTSDLQGVGQLDINQLTEGTTYELQIQARGDGQPNHYSAEWVTGTWGVLEHTGPPPAIRRLESI